MGRQGKRFPNSRPETPKEHWPPFEDAGEYGSKVVAHAIVSIGQLSEDRAREETARVAKREIAQAGVGLRALELIATIAPLLGLLGTVLGMIAAFQALQQAGNRADPALLAGGIWEALLTTAAGMAVAIPASAALTWFEAVIDRIRRDVEDGATRLFVAHQPQRYQAGRGVDGCSSLHLPGPGANPV